MVHDRLADNSAKRRHARGQPRGNTPAMERKVSAAGPFVPLCVVRSAWIVADTAVSLTHFRMNQRSQWNVMAAN